MSLPMMTVDTGVLKFHSDIRIIRFDTVQFSIYRGADKSLARPGRKKLQRQKILIFLFIIIIRGIFLQFIYITRLAS